MNNITFEYKNKSNSQKEDIEWIRIWCEDTNDILLPRVALIGDSITEGYYNMVKDLLKDIAKVDYLATSYSVASNFYSETILNIIRGDMSLVGPRPELPHFVEQFKGSIPFYMVKHQVKPGMTGWAQVNGYRGDTSIEKRVELDLWYIDHWSAWLDIQIIFKTVFGGMINNEKTKENNFV